MFPTDPDFLQRAGPVLDLYQGRWEGRRLHPADFVICTDEKPSIQARRRIHDTLPPRAGEGQRVEHTYQRRGALTYLAALDIRRPRVFGRSEPRGGIAPFERLVWQVMTKEPYASARRVFWIVDNGSSHRGQASIDRLQRRWPNLILVHLPIHASWLNQAEIYSSIVQRKVLQPNDFDNTAAVAHALNAFERHWNEAAEPFDWNFTRDDLARLMHRLAAQATARGLSAVRRLPEILHPMRDTPADLQKLQTLLDDSVERASAFLRSSFQMPEHSLSATQLVAHLEGFLTVALGTVTARGEPRVAPVGALFLRGSFYLPTVAEAARARHLERRPGASLTYFEGTDLAVVAHGHVTIIDANNPDFAELDATHVECGNQSVRDWQGHGVYLHLQPTNLFTFARNPDRYPPASP